MTAFGRIVRSWARGRAGRWAVCARAQARTRSLRARQLHRRLRPHEHTTAKSWLRTLRLVDRSVRTGRTVSETRFITTVYAALRTTD